MSDEPSTTIDILQKDEIDVILDEKIEKILSDANEFSTENAENWTNSIINESIQELVKLKRPYKLVVTCTINQRCGNAFYQYVTCSSDPLTDVVTSKHWKNDLIHCTVSVFAIPL